MRQDMTKVFHEPGRVGGWGSRTNRVRLHQVTDPDTLPSRERLRSRTRERTNSHAPLRRFLLSRVGRKWDAVFSEICRTVGSAGKPALELREALGWLVETDVVLIDGEPYTIGWGSRLPVNRSHKPVWVHPTTGNLMRRVPGEKQRFVRKPAFEHHPIDKTHKLVKMDDLWYVVTFLPVPFERPEEPLYDKVTGDFVVRGHRNIAHLAKRQWGDEIYAVSRRSANSREIRQFVQPGDSTVLAS